MGCLEDSAGWFLLGTIRLSTLNLKGGKDVEKRTLGHFGLSVQRRNTWKVNVFSEIKG